MIGLNKWAWPPSSLVFPLLISKDDESVSRSYSYVCGNVWDRRTAIKRQAETDLSESALTSS